MKSRRLLIPLLFLAPMALLPLFAQRAGGQVGAPPATQPAADKRLVQKVSTVEEFIRVLGPDRIIELAPGDYDLSQAKRVRSVAYRWDPVMQDQYALIIHNAVNLTIRAPGDEPAHILTPYTYANVLTFENADNLELSHLKIGHAPDAGSCTGGVVAITDAKHVRIERCTLYGCGTEGLRLKKISALAFTSSIIEGCSYGILTANDCTDLSFQSSTFRNNVKFHGFDFTDTTGILFRDCTIRDNTLGALDYPLFKTNLSNDDGKITFTGGQIIASSAAALVNTPGMLQLNKTTERDNSWQALPEVIKLRKTKLARADGSIVYHTGIGETTLFDVGIAVYGDGRLADVLQKANPHLPAVIRPDTLVVCPPGPVAPPEK